MHIKNIFLVPLFNLMLMTSAFAMEDEGSSSVQRFSRPGQQGLDASMISNGSKGSVYSHASRRSTRSILTEGFGDQARRAGDSLFAKIMAGIRVDNSSNPFSDDESSNPFSDDISDRSDSDDDMDDDGWGISGGVASDERLKQDALRENKRLLTKISKKRRKGPADGEDRGEWLRCLEEEEKHYKENEEILNDPDRCPAALERLRAGNTNIREVISVQKEAQKSLMESFLNMQRGQYEAESQPLTITVPGEGDPNVSQGAIDLEMLSPKGENARSLDAKAGIDSVPEEAVIVTDKQVDGPQLSPEQEVLLWQTLLDKIKAKLEGPCKELFSCGIPLVIPNPSAFNPEIETPQQACDRLRKAQGDAIALLGFVDGQSSEISRMTPADKARNWQGALEARYKTLEHKIKMLKGISIKKVVREDAIKSDEAPSHAIERFQKAYEKISLCITKVEELLVAVSSQAENSEIQKTRLVAQLNSLIVQASDATGKKGCTIS